MTELVECVSFMLIRDGQLLVEKRKETKPVDPSAIAIPGGHMEAQESLEETLVREMREELNLTPTDAAYLCTLLHKTQEFEKIHYFVIRAWEGMMENHEAEALLWIDLEDIHRIDLAADRAAVGEYKRLFASD